MIIDNNGRYVYHLILEGTVVYVGQTTNVIQRIFTHKSDKGKIYDSFKICTVSSDIDLDTAEFQQIVKHRPILNKSLPSLPCAVYKHRVKQISECIKDVGLAIDDFYNIDKPDMTVELNDKTYKLWAKKGYEEEFNKLRCMCNGLEDRLND